MLPVLSESRGWRFVTLCMLYVAQGLPNGFLTVALVAYLAKLGVDAGAAAGAESAASPIWDEGAIGEMLAMCVLPWALKWIWGPIIDRFSSFRMGRRRSWIVFAQVMMGLTILLMLVIPGLLENINAMIWMVFIHNCFASLQDVSTDAMAVEILDESERGRVSGFMTGSSYFGMSLGGAVFGTLIVNFGISVAITVQGLLLFCIMLFPILLRERRTDTWLPFMARSNDDAENPEITGIEEKRSILDVVKSIKLGFSRRSALMLAALALCARVPIALLGPLVAVLLIKDLEWSQEKFSWIMGLAAWPGLIGSILGGICADLFGARRMFAWASISMGVMFIIFAGIREFWVYDYVFIAEIIIETFLVSVMTASLVVMAMSQSLKVVAATQFTLYMACINFSTSTGSWLAKHFKEIDIRWVFVGSGIWYILIAFLLYGIVHKKMTKTATEELVPDINAPG